MSKILTAFRLIKKSKLNFMAALLENVNFLFPDELYLRLMFRLKMQHKLDLNNPQTFSEKIQWLKLYNRKPLYTSLVDKYAVKDYVAKIIGEEYIIPTLGVWNSANDINFDILPDQFVLKTTNGSGGNDVVICKDRSKFDKANAIIRLNRSLKKNVYKSLREWPYKNVQPRIIAEKYMEDESGELRDYKFFCFNGKVKCLQVDYDRFVEHHRNIYDTNWNLLPFTIKYPSKENSVIKKPENFSIMLDFAARLSENIPHVRVDLYNINGHVYFGEMTFFHGSGYEKFCPDVWNRQFGDWIELPMKEGK